MILIAGRPRRGLRRLHAPSPGAGSDAFAHILLNSAYVFAALVAVQVPRLMKLPFALSWWALSFPLAALSVASFVYGREAASGVHIGIGLAVSGAAGRRGRRAVVADRDCDPARRDLPPGMTVTGRR